MAYNSQFTGSQIDSAISFIINKLQNLFAVNSSDDGKYLKIVNGDVAWVYIDDAEEVGF